MDLFSWNRLVLTLVFSLHFVLFLRVLFSVVSIVQFLFLYWQLIVSHFRVLDDQNHQHFVPTTQVSLWDLYTVLWACPVCSVWTKNNKKRTSQWTMKMKWCGVEKMLWEWKKRTQKKTWMATIWRVIDTPSSSFVVSLTSVAPFSWFLWTWRWIREH
jgi:hypothetical protein